MVEGGRLEIYFGREPDEGSNPSLSAIIPGEVTEWPKVHDWKSCVGQPTEGSNPSLSAIFERILLAREVRVGPADRGP